MRLRLLLLVFLALTIQPNVSFAQAYCNNPLGAIAPNMTWQYFYHTCRGYVTFQAQAGCTYQFTYCSSYAPSANYNGDPYLTISTQPTSGNLAQNDDFCGLGSYINWTAPSTGTFYLNLGNCCSSGCGCGFNRNLGYRSTNCAGGVTSPTSITASAATICAGQSSTLTANGTMGTQNWYTGSCGGTLIGSGASITVSPAATTTYYVNNNSNGQASPSCATITITVNASPQAPSVNGNLVLCGPGSTVLTASGGLATYNWYANAAGSTLLGTGASFTTPVINTTTTYYVNTQQAGNFGVGSQTFNFTGGPQSFTAPVTGTYTFDLYGARGGNVTSYYPTNGGLGGRAQGTTTLNAGQVINVYVGGQGQDRMGNHPYGSCTFVPGGWNGGGANRSAGNGTPGGGASDIRVGGNALANRIIVAGGGGGCGWTYAAGGNGGGLTGAIGGNNPNSGGTQVSGGAVGNSAGGCGQSAGSLGQGGDGSGSSAGGGGGGGGFYGGGGGGYNNGGGGGSSYVGGVNGGTTTIGVQNGNGQIIISWNAQGCPSPLTPVTVTINPQPVITATGATICSGQTATLTATANVPGGTFTWNPGNLTGASVTVTPNTTTQYTVSYSVAGCPPYTATATVTVNALPAAPTANNVTLCGPGTATLTATGGQNNSYVWYSNANGTGQLSTSASYTTPNLQSTTTYYVQTATAQGGSQNFPFTGGVQNFAAPVSGVYTIQAWGAKGGDDGNIGANGGYATGTVALTAGQTLAVYTGGLGASCAVGGGGGWNGGGNAGPQGCSGGGGGASDVRLGGVALGNRILVAGGGGGAGCCGQQAGAGGGLNGNNGSGVGGTQAAGGGGNAAGSLGQGGNKNGDGGGGGGGYYGGGAAFNDDGGGGGSSYIGGVLGGNSIAGNASMPNPIGGNMTGNAGNGFVRITWLGVSCPSALTPVTVTVNPVPVVTVTNATVCAGQQSTLTATSTVPGGTFTWSPGGTTGSTITVTPNTTTTYTATYTVAGCPPVTGTGTVTINPLQPITGTLSACLGLTSQLANAVTPGTWSSSNTGVATISASGLVTGVIAGTSTITYNAANGCSTTSQFTVFPQPVLTATPSNVLCFGSTGSVSLSAAGANAPYTYGGSPTQNLQPGTYTYTAISVDGCVSAPVSVTITQPQAALALSTTQVNVLCSGNNTGSINLTVTGGTAPYTYAWSNNTALEDPTGLAAGTYTVTVTDANGCTATTTVTITQPSTLTSSYTQVNVGCFGNNAGSINLTVNGGVSPYVYAWSNQAITEDLNNIPSGVYTVTATDANGCTTTQTVTITQPQAALALSTTQVNVLCFGNSTGSVNLTATGGTAPYTYLWSNNGTAEDPTGMAAGWYGVTVTDANGCVDTSSVIITQPQAGLALTTTQVNVLCFGNSTGSVNLTVTGGTAPYTYAWSNNTALEDPTGLAAGTYTVTVTDANGCTATTTVTITQPSTLTSSYTQVNVGCFGNNTGSINLTVNGGVAPYVYAWSNQAITEDLNNIPSGVYTVTATDANGCTTTQTVTITQPQAALALSTTQVNVLCFGNSTGSVNLTATGGTAPYTYLWSNNGTAEDPTGMASGAYTVTVTDANGCTAQTSVTITQPQAGLALSTTQVNVLCFGNSTGSVNLTVTGGTAPYTYAWSNNTALEDPTGLAAGTYTVTVTDANGCTAQSSVTITQPASAVSVTTQSQNILCLNGTGSVNSTPTGGVAPYTYSWTNNAVTQNITNLQAGSYTVTVQDANGCTAQSLGTVATTLSPLPVQILNITGTTILTCTNPTIVLQATGGVTYAWSGGSTPSNDTNSITQPGLYTVNMVDPNGCPVSQTITLTQNITPPTPGITNITGTTIIDCNAPSIDLQATGGGTYQWNNNLGTSASVNTAQAGTYTVVVTAANGCQDSSTVAITVAPVPAVTVNDTTICSGQSVTLTPTYYPAGGQAIWTNGQSTASITVSPNTTTLYSVLYTWNGCTATDDITVTVNPTPTVSVNNPNICFGDTTQITATPNIPNGSFNWITTNETTQSISVSPQVTTTYDVEYTLNGCTSAIATSTVTVTPLPIITVPNIIICEGATGTLTATANVAGGTFTWSQGGSTSSITESPQATTSYSVSYSVNGCTSNTESPTITVNPLPNVSFTADTTSGCIPVVVTLSADTTGQQATYTWTSNGASGTTGPNGQMLFAIGGCYDVTLTATLNGCSFSTTQPGFVCVQDYPQASFESNPPSFSESSQVINFNNTSVGATGYVWNFGDGNVSNQEYPEHLFQGTNDGYTITLIASTSMGCMDSTSFTMSANLGAVYYIPNSFTPDGDKYNQIFKPVFSTGISTEQYEMLIFNRWGEIMFESNNIYIGWDGSYGVEGLDCPSGTYTYKIKLTLNGGLQEQVIVTGHVNLLR
jgi:gliding motility-associated-like protein